MKRYLMVVSYRNGNYSETEIIGGLRLEEGFYIAKVDAPVDTHIYINRSEVVHLVLEEVHIH